MDLLEVEVQNYDILVFTETWLSPQISNDNLLLENFDSPYRQDPQVSYRILGRGYFSPSLFAEKKYTEIEGRGSHLK